MNPLEAPAPFWTNVYYGFNGIAAFLIAASILAAFVGLCLCAIVRVERLEELYIYIYIYIYGIYIYTHICVYIYIYTHTRIHVYVYVYTHIHNE